MNRVAALLVSFFLSLVSPSAAQEPPEILLRSVLTIGEVDGRPERTFHRLAHVTASPDGAEIYVLDGGNRTIRVFRNDGRYLRSLGREGGGPGELQFPTRVHVDSLVHVHDPVSRRVTTWGRDGRLRGTSRLPDVDGVPLAGTLPLRHGATLGFVLAQYSPGMSGHRPHAAVIVSPRPGRVDTLLAFHGGGTVWKERGQPVPFGIARSDFGAGGAGAAWGDSVVAVADGYAGKVRWYRVLPGRLELIRERAIPSRGREITGEDLREVERTLRDEPRQGRRLPRHIELMPPPRWSIATSALFSDDGALWIRNSEGRERENFWTVFDREGRVSFRARMPMGFDLRQVRGNELYGITRTEDDAQMVRVYLLER